MHPLANSFSHPLCVTVFCIHFTGENINVQKGQFAQITQLIVFHPCLIQAPCSFSEPKFSSGPKGRLGEWGDPGKPKNQEEYSLNGNATLQCQSFSRRSVGPLLDL